MNYHTPASHIFITQHNNLACVVIIVVLAETAASLWRGCVMVILYLILFIEQVLILASSPGSLGSNKHTHTMLF